MPNKGFYNLTGGTNLVASALNMNSSENKTDWADSENMEFFGQGGIAKMNGNEKFIEIEDAKILGITSYKKGPDDYLVFVYGDATEGHLCIADVVSKTYTVVKSGLDKNARCNFQSHLNGVVVANGVDDPFMYIKDGTPSIINTNIRYQRGVSGVAMASFKGRLFMSVPDKGTIYYSALGEVDNWIRESDAGYVENFHGSTAPITAMAPYGEGLAIYRDNQVYMLSGSGPSDFVIEPFADKGSLSCYGIANYDNKQLFYSHGIFALEFSSLHQVQMSREFSLKINPAFKTLDADRINETTAVLYQKNRQVWFYFPEEGETDLSICWVMDRKDLKNIAWYKRRATPITCATVYKDNIYTGTSDGRILIEDTGDTLDGEVFEGYWYSPWFMFNDSRLKSVETGLDILFDGSKTGNTELRLRYNTVETKVRRKQINTTSGQLMVWGKDPWGSRKWKDNRSLIKRVNVPGVFTSIQIGFYSATQFAINGFAFFDIMLEE